MRCVPVCLPKGRCMGGRGPCSAQTPHGRCICGEEGAGGLSVDVPVAGAPPYRPLALVLMGLEADPPALLPQRAPMGPILPRHGSGAARRCKGPPARPRGCWLAPPESGLRPVVSPHCHAPPPIHTRPRGPMLTWSAPGALPLLLCGLNKLGAPRCWPLQRHLSRPQMYLWAVRPWAMAPAGAAQEHILRPELGALAQLTDS